MSDTHLHDDQTLLVLRLTPTLLLLNLYLDATSIAQLDLPPVCPSSFSDRRSSLMSNGQVSPKVEGITNNFFPGAVGSTTGRTASWRSSPLRGGFGSGAPLPLIQGRGLDFISPRSSLLEASDRQQQRSPVDLSGLPALGEHHSGEASRSIKRHLNYDQDEEEDDSFFSKRRALESVSKQTKGQSSSLPSSGYPPLPHIRKRSVSDSVAFTTWKPHQVARRDEPPASPLRPKGYEAEAWFWDQNIPKQAQNDKAEDERRRASLSASNFSHPRMG